METEFAQPIEDRFLSRGLAGVLRFGRKTLLHPKSVAEHTYEVARNARWIAILLKSKGIEVDEVAVADIALVHDEEEEVSGDIVHPVKHDRGVNGEEAQEIEAAFSTISFNAVSLLYSKMPYTIRERALAAWKRYKARECIESQVVKVADLLSGLAECQEERSLGNTTLRADEERYTSLYQEAKLTYSWVKEVAEFLP